MGRSRFRCGVLKRGRFARPSHEYIDAEEQAQAAAMFKPSAYLSNTTLCYVLKETQS